MRMCECEKLSEKYHIFGKLEWNLVIVGVLVSGVNNYTTDAASELGFIQTFIYLTVVSKSV